MASPHHPPGHVEVASASSASEIRDCVASTRQDQCPHVGGHWEKRERSWSVRVKLSRSGDPS